MKLKVNFDQRPQVVDLRISEKNADVVICTLESGEEFGAHSSLFEDGEPMFLNDDNRLLKDYELFTSRTTDKMWVREKSAQRGFTW
jgi:hypothetical protein